MKYVRQQGGKSAAVFAVLALLAVPSIASAVILSGGPVDVLPGGGGC